jgi:hypothetical protein
MKRYPKVFLILLIMPLVLGMGSFDSVSSPNKIPIPEKKYKASFIDQMDITTECQNVSIEGNTVLEGKIGNGSHAISFDKIHDILFHQIGDRLTGIVKLSDSSTIELSVNKSAKAFGMTKHGTFQIKLIDLKKMTIEGAIK